MANLNREEIAAKEKAAARFLELGQIRFLLLAAVIVHLIGLVLPHSGSVHGWQVLFFQASGAVSMPETLFTVLSTLAITVFGSLLVVTRRTLFANLSYLLIGMSTMISLLALWLRIQGRENAGQPGIGIGFILEIIAVIAMLVLLSMVVFARSADQRAVLEERAATERQLDTIGKAQLEAQAVPTPRPEENPLLIDDRRQRAALRHKQQ